MTKQGIKAFSWVVALVMIMTMLAPFALRTQTVHAISSVGFTPTPTTASAVAQYSVAFTTGATLTGGTSTVTISFPLGTVLPASIAPTSVTIGGGGNSIGAAPLNIAPSVSVAARSVTLIMPSTTPAGAAYGNPTAGAIVAFFSVAAGIKNPQTTSVAAGTAAAFTSGCITTSGESIACDASPQAYTRAVVFTPSAAQNLGALTVSGWGFTPLASVVLTGGAAGAGTVLADGSFTATGAAIAAAAIVATDGAGLAGTSAAVVLLPTLTTFPTSGKVGDRITLLGNNFTGGGNIAGFANVSLGGTNLILANTVNKTFALAHTDRDGDGTSDDFAYIINIPSGTTAGAKTIVVTDSGAVVGVASVNVTGRTVALTPSSGPPGTIVTIAGTGFPANITAATTGYVAANNTIVLSPVFGFTTVTGLVTDGNGNLSGSFAVPAAALSTNITVLVTITDPRDAAATIGAGVFTAGARALTATPTSGPRGTKVTISGTGFGANVEIDPLNVNAQVSGANGSLTIGGVSAIAAGVSIVTTSLGALPATTVTVPATTPLGAQSIVALDSSAALGIGAFSITQPTMSMAPVAATMGQAVTITGAGWVPSSVVTITGAIGAVTHVTSTITSDSTGSFTVSVVIPNSVGVGPTAVLFSASDGTLLGNNSLPVTVGVGVPTIVIDPTSAGVGDTVTVTGQGFQPSTGLTTLTVGGANVIGTTPIVTTTTGGFVATFTVPGLTGNQLVSGTVSGVTATASLAVSAAAANVKTQMSPISSVLVRVWAWDNTGKAWQLYDTTGPEAANDLAVLARGQAANIVVTADTTLITSVFTYSLTAGDNIVGWQGP